MQIIHKLTAPNYLWVATGKPLKNRDAVLEVIKRGLLLIRDADALAAVDDNLRGFEPVSPTDVDDWESTLEKARQFDEVE